MTLLKIRRQFGLWDSPISSVRMARGIGFSDAAWDPSGALVWREGRADRGVLVVQPPDGGAARDLNSDYSVRARVGYGGGDFGVGHGSVYFAEAASGRIFRQPVTAGEAQAITPAFGAAAALTPSLDGRWLLFVHSYEDQDSLAIVDTAGTLWPIRLAAGHDFYMQPCWHPSSQRLAFLAWDHPNMPWDGTGLYLGELACSEAGAPNLPSCHLIAGSPDGQVSIFQPAFSPDGKSLAYVSDETGWWQLYLYDLARAEHRQLTHVLAEHAQPAWGQGVRTYNFSPDGRDIYFIRCQDGFNTLWRLELATGIETQVILDENYTQLEQIAISPDGEKIALIASGPALPTRLVTCRLDGQTTILRRATSEDLPQAAYAAPRPFSWEGLDKGRVYGLFCLPQNERFEGVGKPPLMVHIHGGPTLQRAAGFNLQAQFYTSRGYAYLDVNYRGSTGYGRAYRDMLRGSWGIYDVQDAISGAKALVDQGVVDGERLVILGGSAGGFTVLKALEDYPGFFKAGICLFGISNQFTAAVETHKFELHYSDSLLGPLPEASAVYRERSPIFFMEKLVDPILLFQGEEDKVVPRNQSDTVVESLRRRGVPHEYHLYPGEGHGFRKAETIDHYYRTVEKFLKQYVIFA